MRFHPCNAHYRLLTCCITDDRPKKKLKRIQASSDAEEEAPKTAAKGGLDTRGTSISVLTRTKILLTGKESKPTPKATAPKGKVPDMFTKKAAPPPPAASTSKAAAAASDGENSASEADSNAEEDESDSESEEDEEAATHLWVACRTSHCRA